ncbi:MAG: TonB-dependent receptor plug domain-containing protein, partial [Bacteroidales bacterium]|nr:TonB-dependent receptor plug domain-containing protein [Bacteroidales bacterium]
IGYQKVTTGDFLVTRSHPVFIDIPMNEAAVTLEDVVIRPDAFIRKEESPLSLQTLSIQEIERSPGANRDISKVVQSLPGVAQTVSFRNDLIVRGGGPGENSFYLDGVEIPNINHFATQGASGGPVGIINTDLIRQIDLYTGSFPAKRGNALSSVMELYQVDGNREKFGGRFSIGSSDIGLSLNGPITKNSSLVFSVRRSYLQLLFEALKLPFLPTYNDYQLKYKINLKNKDQISLISIGALDNSKLNTGIKDPDASQTYILGYLPEYNQWSYTIGIVYTHFRKKGYDNWIVSRSMLNNEETKYRDNIDNPDSLLLNYTSRDMASRIRYEGVSDLKKWKISYGAGLDFIEYKNSTYQKLFLADEVRTLDYSSYLNFFRWHIQGQVTRNFFREKLELSLGIRMDANSYADRMINLLNQLSPRLSASYAFTDKWFLNFNIGRYYQLPPTTSLGFRDNRGTLVNDSLGIRYISSDQVALGIEFLPRRSSRISLEGFYKEYGHYPFSLTDSISMASKGGDYGAVGAEPVTSTSSGRAYGFEVLYRDVDLFKFNVILSYTFVRSEFTNVFGQYIPSAWDNRNLFNITVGRKFKFNWEIGAKWRFAGGAPYTPYDYNKSSLVAAWDAQGRGYLDYSQFNTLRLSSFNQLDLRIDKGFYFKKWSLMFYIDIQNLLNFKAELPDILVNTQPDGSVITYTDPDGNERYQLRTIPNKTGTILPSIGIMVDF